jgi:hypothetical protein
MARVICRLFGLTTRPNKSSSPKGARDLIANAAYLACLRLQEALGDRLPVQLDLAHRGALSREPWRAFGGVADTGSALPLADVIDTLVIEADGTVSPVQHGFDRTHALGNLIEAPLPVLASRWRARRPGAAACPMRGGSGKGGGRAARPACLQLARGARRRLIPLFFCRIFHLACPSRKPSFLRGIRLVRFS